MNILLMRHTLKEALTCTIHFMVIIVSPFMGMVILSTIMVLVILSTIMDMGILSTEDGCGKYNKKAASPLFITYYLMPYAYNGYFAVSALVLSVALAFELS